jgi:aarF domain-containing kinase
VLDPYEKSLIMKEKLRQFLTDTERFPKALVFLGRNMRMVQGMKHPFVFCLRYTGSPAS